MSPFRLLLFALLLVMAPLAALAAADEGQAGTGEARRPVPEGLRSPRATMATFLHAMNDIKRGEPGRIEDAISTLDLGAINPLVRRERAPDLAWMLLEVLDRTARIDLERIPARTTGPPWVFHSYRRGTVRIVRQADGRWLFDRETLLRLPEILDEVGDRPRLVGGEGDVSHLPLHLRLRQSLPEGLRQRAFLLENWLWVALLIIVALGVLADRLVSLVLRLAMGRWLSHSRCAAFRDVPRDTLRPLGLMAMALVWWVGINLLGLPEPALLILLVAVKFLASISGVWAAYRLVDLAAAWLREWAAGTDNKLDDVLAPLVPRTLKIFVTVVGVVFVADNLNIDVTGLVAGLGLGGLAFALAAKDMVQNLFGSITVLLDRTFTVGDWIVVGDLEGTVEHMGFRSTRIRTFYNSVLTVPNSRFITAAVDNMGARRYRRMSTRYALTYDTPPDRIEAFCEGVRELVRQHPYMRKDYYHVYLNAFADSSLEVLVYVFWETPDWATELRERHRFLLDCLRLAHALEVSFAFPTQTIYLNQEGGGEVPDEALAPEAAAALGQRKAREVVAAGGAGERPPPVRF